MAHSLLRASKGSLPRPPMVSSIRRASHRNMTSKPSRVHGSEGLCGNTQLGCDRDSAILVVLQIREVDGPLCRSRHPGPVLADEADLPEGWWIGWARVSSFRHLWRHGRRERSRKMLA